MRKVFILNVIFVFVFQNIKAQLLPVDLVCSSVASNGDVTITWIPKYSSLDFARYEVWYTKYPVMGFSKIAEVTDIAQNSYIHAGAAAHLQEAYYFVKTVAISQAFAISDTIATLRLEGQLVNQTYVQLKWNTLMPVLPPTNYGFYRIFWQKPNMGWILLDSVAETVYSHKVLPCNDNYYRIEMGDQSCISTSAVLKIDRDIEQPPTPTLDSVSVNGGQVIIGWQPPIAPDVQGYVVYRQNAGIWDTLALLEGANQRFFVDTTADPHNQSYLYCVAAFDRCGNASADMGIPQAQQTILLDEPVFDVCADRISLSWSAYTNMPGDLKGYRILARESTDLEYILAVVGTNTLNYTFEHPLDGIVYSFRIQAFNESTFITSTSNQQTLKVRKPPAPEYAYIRYVNVIMNQNIMIQIFADTSAPSTEFRLFRSNPANGNFELLTVLNSSSVNLPYVDTNVNVHKRQYFYRLAISDSCQNIVLVSNTISSIFLTNPAGSTFEWTPLDGWDIGVETYQIYKIIGADTSLAAEVGPSANSWIDEDIDFAQGALYFVKAIETMGNHYGFKEEVVSNTIQLSPRFSIAIANAFTPWRETNNIFKPRLISFDPANYYFAIYNRFGQKIYETNSPDEGWDGTVKGKRAPSDVYVYFLRVLNSKGRYIEQRAAVLLLD